MAITSTFILFIIATIPILFAAVQPWVWSVYSTLMISAFLTDWWQNRIRLSAAQGRGVNFAVILFFSTTMLLCLPLPGGILEYLSPVRFQALATARVLLDGPAGWQTLSYSPQVAFSWWLFLFSLCLFFVVVRDLCVESKKLKLIVFIMIGVSVIEALYGLIQALVPSLGVLWVDYVQAYMGDARGTFINRNHFAGLIEMVLPLALGFTLAQGGWGQRYTLKKILASERLNRQSVFTLAVVMLLLALLFSRSRAGIAGALIGLFTFFLLARSAARSLSGYTWLLLGAIVVLLVIYSVKIGIGPIVDRFQELDTANSRLDYWRDSLPMVIDHPFGIGLRNFDKVFPVYNLSNLSENVVDHAHNDYLQLLIEAGWIGFTAVISGFLIFMVKSASKIKRLNFQKDPMRFFLAVGAFSGLVSMAFHSFFDFNLQIPANCVYFVILLAIVHTCCWRSTPACSSKLKTDGSKPKNGDARFKALGLGSE